VLGRAALGLKGRALCCEAPELMPTHEVIPPLGLPEEGVELGPCGRHARTGAAAPASGHGCRRTHLSDLLSGGHPRLAVSSGTFLNFFPLLQLFFILMPTSGISRHRPVRSPQIAPGDRSTRTSRLYMEIEGTRRHGQR